MNKKTILVLAIVFSAFIYAITWSPSVPVEPQKVAQTYCYPAGNACSMDDGCGYFFAWTSCGNGGGGGNKRL